MCNRSFNQFPITGEFPGDVKQGRNEKNLLTFYCTGCLMGVLMIMIYYNPRFTGFREGKFHRARKISNNWNSAQKKHILARPRVNTTRKTWFDFAMCSCVLSKAPNKGNINRVCWIHTPLPSWLPFVMPWIPLCNNLVNRKKPCLTNISSSITPFHRPPWKIHHFHQVSDWLLDGNVHCCNRNILPSVLQNVASPNSNLPPGPTSEENTGTRLGETAPSSVPFLNPKKMVIFETLLTEPFSKYPFLKNAGNKFVSRVWNLFQTKKNDSLSLDVGCLGGF